MNGFYTLMSPQTLRIPAGSDKQLITELLDGFAHGVCFTIQTDAPAGTVIWGAPAAEAERGTAEYAFCITDGGVHISGADSAAAMRGLIAVLERLELCKADRRYRLPCVTASDSPKIPFRAVHLCVFPETTLAYLQKCIRACGVMKYSHVVLEFWGMFRFTCMPELGWPQAYTKEQLRPLIREANTLGMEVIPMFNHLGHAAGARGRHGKHVVLDQNRGYEYMFNSHGWEWDFELPEVRALLRQVRAELMDLCGAGGYFHLGCDEAYSIGTGKNRGEALCAYLNEITVELKAAGRRPIIWGDMLLSRKELGDTAPDRFSCNSSVEIAQTIRGALSRDVVIADWHYNVTAAEVWPTSVLFKKEGFDVLACPWDSSLNIHSALSSVEVGGFMGVMHTTWHTLHSGFPMMLYTGSAAWNGLSKAVPAWEMRQYAAEITRRVSFAEGDYAAAGWSEKSVGPGL